MYDLELEKCNLQWCIDCSRKDMITWSEKIRNEDPAYFCLKSIEKYCAERFPIWIVSDCRRKTDFDFFEKKFTDKIVKIRVKASEEIRKCRGFIFQAGVDDAESECGLDNVFCEHEFENDGSIVPEVLLKPILNLL